MKSRNVIWITLHLIWEDLFPAQKNSFILYAILLKGLKKISRTSNPPDPPKIPNCHTKPRGSNGGGLGLIPTQPQKTAQNLKNNLSDPAFVLQGLNLVPFPPSKRDALGAILASCRDEGKDPALVFSMICYDGKVLCMCQVIKISLSVLQNGFRTNTFLHLIQ